MIPCKIFLIRHGKNIILGNSGIKWRKQRLLQETKLAAKINMFCLLIVWRVWTLILIPVVELGRQLAGGGGTCANSLFSMLLPGESASCASTASPRVSFVLFRAPRGSVASLPNRNKSHWKFSLKLPWKLLCLYICLSLWTTSMHSSRMRTARLVGRH